MNGSNELCDVDEGQEANVPKYGFRPTPEEVEKHNMTHIPFRSWCAYCVAGKAKTDAHKQSELCKPDGVNVVSLDYAFMGIKRMARQRMMWKIRKKLVRKTEMKIWKKNVIVMHFIINKKFKL